MVIPDASYEQTKKLGLDLQSRKSFRTWSHTSGPSSNAAFSTNGLHNQRSHLRRRTTRFDPRRPPATGRTRAPIDLLSISPQEKF